MQSPQQRPAPPRRSPSGLGPWGEPGERRGGAAKVVLLACVVAGLAVGAYYLFGPGRRARGPAATAPAALTASAGRVTLASDDGRQVTDVSRRSSPELYYRVVLENAPTGDRLALTCDWVDPAGRVVRQNRYRTQTITTQSWGTYARYRLGPDSPAGTWTVRLNHEGRRLIETSFSVHDGGDAPATQQSSPAVDAEAEAEATGRGATDGEDQP